MNSTVNKNRDQSMQRRKYAPEVHKLFMTQKCKRKENPSNSQCLKIDPKASFLQLCERSELLFLRKFEFLRQKLRLETAVVKLIIFGAKIQMIIFFGNFGLFRLTLFIECCCTFFGFSWLR